MPEQLPSDQRDLVTSRYLDPSPDCVCGHEEGDHLVPSESVTESMPELVAICIGSDNCHCQEYRPKDDYYYEELRQEAMLARWEDR